MLYPATTTESLDFAIWSKFHKKPHKGESRENSTFSWDPCGGDALHGFEVYLTWVGIQNSLAFKGFLAIIYIGIRVEETLCLGLRFT